MNRQEVDAKALETLEDVAAAIRRGNYVAIFTMLILQEILIELTVNPLTNFNYIIAVSTTIAALNASVKPIP